MSRAMNLNLPEADVLQLCVETGIEVSAIETLPSGGTHLVCKTSEGAEAARLQFAASMIEGNVKRFPFSGTRHRSYLDWKPQ